jgi:hypothetical protein
MLVWLDSFEVFAPTDPSHAMKDSLPGMKDSFPQMQDGSPEMQDSLPQMTDGSPGMTEASPRSARERLRRLHAGPRRVAERGDGRPCGD